MADPLAQRPVGIQLPKVLQKYQDPALLGLPNNVVGPVMQIDLDRIRKGQSPLSQGDTALALQAAQTQEAVTKQPKGNIFGRALDDLEGMLQSIPHLPGALLNEFGALPEAPGQIAQGISHGSIGEVARAPGVRMLPGAFIASEGPKAFWEHPIFAAMDVAPYATKGLKMLPTELTEAAKAPVVSALDRLGVGPMSRETARTIAVANRRLTARFQTHAAEIAELTKGMSEGEITRLTGIMERGNPQEISALSRSDKQLIDKVRGATAKLSQEGIKMGMLGEFDNEIYPIAQAQAFQKQRTRYWNAVAKGDDAGAAAALRKFDRLSGKTPPARFRPALDEVFQNRLTTLAKDRDPTLTGAAWDEVQKMVSDRFYDMVPNVTEKDLSRLASEVAPMWQTMKDNGIDPVFIHSVGSEQVGRLRNPKVFPGQETNPTSVRARTWNMKPGIQNFAVGLNHQGMEFLQHQVTEEVINTFQSMFGKTRGQLVQEYGPLAEKLTSGPGVPNAMKVEHLMSKDYVKWNPDTIAPWRKARATAGITPEEEIFLPKAVEQTIRKMYPIDRSALARLWDASMGVFRTGILPLSPRWHIYNTIGGAALMLGRTGPEALTFMDQAYKMVKDGTMPEALSHGMVSVPADVRAWNFEAGQQIGRMLKDNWANKIVQKVGEPASNFIQKSYQFNEFIDNMYRSMTYLYGESKALKKGMSKLEAEEAGIKLSNKVLQDWDSMTPIERQVIRSIFPFYGWAKHILGYVMTYPWDHPYRASIVGNFARNELDDWGSGVPSQFQNYLFFGKPDEFGNQTGVNVRGANPFADVANYFTLAGFVSQMNPAMTGLMTAMGFNPRTGSASLYPGLTYNENTGKLQARTSNPLLTIAEGLAPQAAGLQSLLGLDDSDMEALKLNNPDAYRSRMLSSFGLPVPTRNINKGLEAARAELARKQVLQTTLNEAIKSGNYDRASKYPQLKPIVAYMKQLDESGALDQYKIEQAGSKGFDVKELLPLVRGGQ